MTARELEVKRAGPDGPVASGMRRLLLALVALGAAGLIAELLLLEHVEEWTQWIPLVVLAAVLPGVALVWLRPARRSLLAFRALMAATFASGVAGLVLHFTGNRAFELEMEEALHGWALVWSSLRGATPTLAPGAMMRKNMTGALSLALVLTLGACDVQDDAPDTTMSDTAARTVEPPAAQPATGFADPNQATREELIAAGLDSAQADALVAGRPWASMVAVDGALGLSEEQRDSVYARVWMPIDLNTASGEEILLIPGIGDRMVHEFEEYRPYREMAQFRREIGKYVDEAEVARLERYVMIR